LYQQATKRYFALSGLGLNYFITLRTALDLEKDELALVAGFSDNNIAPMLLELGCRPGQRIRLLRKALFNGPLCLEIEDRILAFRQDEARTILLTDPR